MRDFGAIWVRDARKTIGKRARDRCVCASKFAQDRRKVSASALQFCGAFGAATAQFRREICAISARFWCATRAKRSKKNVRAIAACELQNPRKIRKVSVRVRRKFWERLAMRTPTFWRENRAILVRAARKTVAKSARDRRARAAKFAQDRQQFCASAPQLCRAFGAATAQFWRANCAISTQF